MNAAIISMGSVSSKWTYDAMKKYFDEVDHLDIKSIEVDISNKPIILYKGKPIKHYDCIFAKGSYKFAMALRALTDVTKSYNKSVYVPYEADSYTVGHDKILTHLKLLHNQVPTPLTYIASSPEAGKQILEKMNYPIIMKIPSGTQGKGVMFADSFASASSMLDTLTTLRQPFLIQEFVETDSTDLRVFVVGNKIVAAMKRIGKKDEKRANIHAGGVGQAIIPTEEVKRIALKTAKAVGAEICGVDILDSRLKGPLVIEVNLSPGLQGIKAATKIDVADKIAAYLSDKTKEVLEGSQKKKSKDVLFDIDTENNKKACIITNLSARGAKLILPEIAHKMSGIDDETEVELCVENGSITIKRIEE
ncbi:RimK family alpha-L-glutamate ligase [Candidatus Woesearchaeota archaeon]|nr:RimK family alpha-L-glutamate ligase [Candidatus Woesearchaeota archaeon]